MKSVYFAEDCHECVYINTLYDNLWDSFYNHLDEEVLVYMDRFPATTEETFKDYYMYGFVMWW